MGRSHLTSRVMVLGARSQVMGDHGFRQKGVKVSGVKRTFSQVLAGSGVKCEEVTVSGPANTLYQALVEVC